MVQTHSEYDVGVIVGRFQTDSLHQGHRDLIKHVTDAHEKVIMFLGVSPLWATQNNPLDFQARQQMIQADFPDLIINYIADMASDAKWSKALDRQIERLLSPAQTVVLYGSRDSFLAHYSGRYAAVELESERIYSGTAERKRIASGNTKATADFRAGVIWATQARYPAGLPTVDIAIFNDEGKLLLGRKPNEDHWRFPGGFFDPTKDTSLEAAAKREAGEETGLEVGEISYVCSQRVDDWRYRSEKDKIVTSLFTAKRIFGAAVPNDDIEEVRWVDPKAIRCGEIVTAHQGLYTALLAHLAKGL